MSDLVKRLRQDDDLSSRIEAADRIEELEATIKALAGLHDGVSSFLDRARNALDTA